MSVRDNQTSEESCVTRMMKMRDVRSQEMEKQMAARPGAGGAPHPEGGGVGSPSSSVSSY